MIRTPRAALAGLIEARAAACSEGRRFVVAFAGPPGSGKSTIVADLARSLGSTAAILPMDGFHLDNAVLDARGLRARKGAPETFDLAGFAAILSRIPTEAEVIFPVFDRAADLARAGAGVIGPETRIVLVEGNYLLLRHPGWAELAAHWALSVWLDVPRDILTDRLIGRWEAHGLSSAAARERALGNDLPNAELVLHGSAPADLSVIAE